TPRAYRTCRTKQSKPKQISTLLLSASLFLFHNHCFSLMGVVRCVCGSTYAVLSPQCMYKREKSELGWCSSLIVSFSFLLSHIHISSTTTSTQYAPHSHTHTLTHTRTI